MTAIPDDYARCQGEDIRCQGEYRPPLGSGEAILWHECLTCLRRTAPKRDNKLYSYMAPPQFTTTCPERIAP